VSDEDDIVALEGRIDHLELEVEESQSAHRRTKGHLAAMQRDRDALAACQFAGAANYRRLLAERDALAAEVRDVDEALRDTGLEHHIPTGQGLNKDTRRLAIECSAAATEEQVQISEALAARVRELESAAAKHFGGRKALRQVVTT
jgi:hypothetical protein